MGRKRDSTRDLIECLWNQVNEYGLSVKKCYSIARNWVVLIWFPPTYHDHPGFKEATTVRTSFTPKDDVDYGWVLEHGRLSYERLEKNFQSIDEKADSLIKYLGGGAAAITIGSLATMTGDSAWIPLLFVPSLIAALVAIGLSVWVRQPKPIPSSPDVLHALKYAEAYNNKAEATTISSWHECCEGLAYVNGLKAARLKIAHWCYFVALLLLLVPMVSWPIRAICAPTPKTPIQVEIVKDASR